MYLIILFIYLFLVEQLDDDVFLPYFFSTYVNVPFFTFFIDFNECMIVVFLPAWSSALVYTIQEKTYFFSHRKIRNYE